MRTLAVFLCLTLTACNAKLPTPGAAPAPAPATVRVTVSEMILKPALLQSPGGRMGNSKATYQTWSLVFAHADPSKAASYAHDEDAYVTDDIGNRYDQPEFDRLASPMRQVARSELYSDKPVETDYFFTRPVPAAKSLTLHLPLYNQTLTVPHQQWYKSQK